MSWLFSDLKELTSACNLLTSSRIFLSSPPMTALVWKNSSYMVIWLASTDSQTSGAKNGRFGHVPTIRKCYSVPQAQSTASLLSRFVIFNATTAQLFLQSWGGVRVIKAFHLIITHTHTHTKMAKQIQNYQF